MACRRRLLVDPGENLVDRYVRLLHFLDETDDVRCGGGELLKAQCQLHPLFNESPAVGAGLGGVEKEFLRAGLPGGFAANDWPPFLWLVTPATGVPLGSH